MTTSLQTLTTTFAGRGRVDAIWLRPARGAAAVQVASAEAVQGRGLLGDRTGDKPPRAGPPGKRQVTLLQGEHLPLLAHWAGVAQLDAGLLRRNLVVSGLNLVGLRSPFADRKVLVHIGAAAVLEFTGPCDPCSKMEAVLGPGGYNAMRGHGGMTARVVASGRIAVGDAVWAGVDDTA
jgi:MOSC domain-containing protein YiiM